MVLENTRNFFESEPNLGQSGVFDSCVRQVAISSLATLAQANHANHRATCQFPVVT